MSVLVILGRKCTLAASRRKRWDRRTDGQTKTNAMPYTLTAIDAASVIIWTLCSKIILLFVIKLCREDHLFLRITHKNSSGDEIANVLVNDDIAHT